MTCEFWMHWFPIPGQVERVASQAEQLGIRRTPAGRQPEPRRGSVRRARRPGQDHDPARARNRHRQSPHPPPGRGRISHGQPAARIRGSGRTRCRPRRLLTGPDRIACAFDHPARAIRPPRTRIPARRHRRPGRHTESAELARLRPRSHRHRSNWPPPAPAPSPWPRQPAIDSCSPSAPNQTASPQPSPQRAAARARRRPRPQRPARRCLYQHRLLSRSQPKHATSSAAAPPSSPTSPPWDPHAPTARRHHERRRRPVRPRRHLQRDPTRTQQRQPRSDPERRLSSTDSPSSAPPNNAALASANSLSSDSTGSSSSPAPATAIRSYSNSPTDASPQKYCPNSADR